jgi:hypothetical protein
MTLWALAFPLVLLLTSPVLCTAAIVWLWTRRRDDDLRLAVLQERLERIEQMLVAQRWA